MQLYLLCPKQLDQRTYHPHPTQEYGYLQVHLTSVIHETSWMASNTSFSVLLKFGASRSSIFDVGGWITSPSELGGSPETTSPQLGFAGCFSRVHWGLFGCSPELVALLLLLTVQWSQKLAGERGFSRLVCWIIGEVGVVWVLRWWRRRRRC